MATLTCQRCGAPLPEDALFCPRCGAPVATAVTEERKVVSVLFADLARSTELAAQLDPERFREVMAEFFRLVSSELDSLRGRAEKFIGDAVMAVFGLPIAHEDDALRAVRAGLVIRDRAARLGEELGLPVPLEVRVGINTGPVATGSGPADQLLVSGAPVNVAARLQEAADPGQILVGDTTWQLSREAVTFGPPQQVPARGFQDEITAYPVDSLTMRSSRRTIPLVGRRHELGLLRQILELVQESSRAHLVTVLGETGIGKTRLADELLSGVPEEGHTLHGRTMEFDEDPVVAPLADMIRREMGVERDARAEDVRARLEELVKGCCDPSEVERTAARIGLMLGFGEGLPRGEGHSFRLAEIRSGLLALIEGLSQTGPVVMVLDDLQLADPQLLDLVEALVASARRLPLMVVALARDWLLEERPEWGSSLPDALRLRLEPLGVEDATELVRRAGESLDEATAEAIARRAGGNPFFIVEMTGMLLQEHVEHSEGIAHSHLLPPTVQAVVASRIDHLPESAKDLVRKASVFPRKTFHESELGLIAEPDPEILHRLEEEELFVRDDERPHVWRFRHGMLRDVAYESLPKRERLRLHLEVAEGLAKEGEDRNLRSIAFHLEQAARASLDLNPSDRSLADRAVEALAGAGNRDRRAMESATAVDEYRRALALSGTEDRWGRHQARILAGIGESQYWLGEFEDAAATLERALELGGDDDWAGAHAGRFLADITLNIANDQRRAEELFDRALEAARRLGDDWVMARTLLMAGWAPFWREDLDQARAMFQQALDIAQANPEGDRWAEARALTSLASVISPVGDEEECLALGRRALELGKEMGDRFTIAVAQSYVGASLRRMWRLDEALPFEQDAVRTFRDLAARWELASTIGDRGSVFRLMGDPARAEEDLLEALRISRAVGDRSLIGWTAAELARVRLGQGDEAGAQEALQEPNVGSMEDQSSMRAAQALILRAAGDTDRARAIAEELLEEARAEGNRNHVAGMTWWVGRLFGEDLAGGADVVEEAGRTLEAAHWIQSLREPDLWTEPVPAG